MRSECQMPVAHYICSCTIREPINSMERVRLEPSNSANQIVRMESRREVRDILHKTETRHIDKLV